MLFNTKNKNIDESGRTTLFDSNCKYAHFHQKPVCEYRCNKYCEHGFTKIKGENGKWTCALDHVPIEQVATTSTPTQSPTPPPTTEPVVSDPSRG